MAGTWDADIKLLSIVDEGTRFTADTTENGDTFEVVADIEIGSDLMEIVTRHELFLSVINVSDAAPLVQPLKFAEVLAPQRNSAPVNREIRLKVAKWKAKEGDLIKAYATYKVSAGVHTDHSTSESDYTFVVTK
jgi:hypothetical protein